MTDWRNLPPGRELDLIISEKLGVNQVVRHIVLYDPSGQETGLAGEYPIAQPYSIDANAALTLVKDLPFYLDKQFWGNYPSIETSEQWSAGIASDTKNDWVEKGATPALAICRVWLAWKEAQNVSNAP